MIIGWAEVSNNLSGTYAARPAANSVPGDTIYYASDVPEIYRSDGDEWFVVGSGGSEIGYSQITYMFSTSNPNTNPKDVTGFTTTFVVGERPIELSFSADVANSVASEASTVYLILDGVVKARPMTRGIFSDVWHTVSRSVRVSGLIPGSTHVAKVALASSSTGSAARITGDPDNPASLSVRTV